jgi:hypothetical protein
MEKAKTNLLFEARGIRNPICNKVVVSSEILDVAACPKYLLPNLPAEKEVYYVG